MLLPSDKLLQEQVRLQQLQLSHEKRRKHFERMSSGFTKQNLVEQRKKEYEDFYRRTKKIGSILDQLSFLSYVTPMISSQLGKVGDLLDSFLTGAYAISKPLRTLRKIKRSQYEQLLEKDLGLSGKITRSLDVLSNISLLTYAYPKVLKATTGLQLHPLRVSTLVSKGLAHGTNAGINILNSLFGTSLPKIPTHGLGAIFSTMPYMALAMGASMMKATKMARLQVRRQSGAVVEREHSLSGIVIPYITRLAAEGQLTPRDQLELQLLQWIESHTSVIPTIYEELDLISQSKEKSGLQVEEISKVRKPKESLLTKIENSVNAAILKYDPITQLINFLTSRKLPKDALQSLLGSSSLKEHWEEIDRLSKILGVGRSQAQLLTLSSSQLISTVPTYEAKMLSLQTGMYDLLRLSVSELSTIRGHGFGIPQNLVHKREVSEEKSVFGKILDTIKSIPEKLVSLPGINALWNVVKLPFTLPRKVYDFVKDFEKSLFLNEDFADFIKHPQEALKKAGLYIPEQELAYRFLGKKLPIVIEDVRTIAVEQLEVEQNIYTVLREVLKHIAGIDISYHETQRQLKQRRQWSSTLGTYLTEKDYRRRRQYEEELVKRTLVEQFEKKSLLGRLKLLGISKRNIDERYEKIRQFLGTLFGAKIHELYKGREESDFEKWVQSSGILTSNVISLEDLRRKKQPHPNVLRNQLEERKVAIAGGGYVTSGHDYRRKSTSNVINMAERIRQMKQKTEYNKWDKFRSGVLDFLEKISDNVTTVADVSTEETKNIVGSGLSFGKSILTGSLRAGLAWGGKLLRGWKAIRTRVPGLLGKGIDLSKLIGSKSLEFFGDFARVGKGILGKAALPLAVLTSAYDAFKGWHDANKVFETNKPTTGMKIASAAGRVLSLGFSDKKVARWLYSIFGGDVIKTATETLKDYIFKVIFFPKYIINKFQELSDKAVKEFDEVVSNSFKWVISLPSKLVDSIKQYLKGTFVGKIYMKLFGKDDFNTVETPDVPHAAFGGLFLKQTLTHIAEGNRPEVVLPLEHPKTSEILHEYVNKYVEKTVSKAHGHVKSLIHGYHDINRHLEAAKRIKHRIDDVIENAKNVTNQLSQTKLAKAAVQAVTPLVVPIQTNTTGSAERSVDTIDSDIELKFDPIIEKHLNEIFCNTIVSLKRSFEDYMYGSIEFMMI